MKTGLIKTIMANINLFQSSKLSLDLNGRLIGQSNVSVKKSSLSQLENLVAFFLAGFKLLWDWLGTGLPNTFGRNNTFRTFNKWQWWSTRLPNRLDLGSNAVES